MEYVLIIAAIVVITFFVLKNMGKPSQADLLTARSEALSLFSVEEGDCEKLVKAKQARLKEIAEVFSSFADGTYKTTKAELKEGYEQTKREVIKLKESIEKERAATIDLYNSTLKVRDSALDVIKSLDELPGDLDNDKNDDDEDVRDIVEKSIEGAEIKLPKLKEKLRELGYSVE